MKKSQDQTNANKKASERNPYYLRKSKMMFKKKRDIRLSQHSERKKRNKVFEQETKERAKIRERKKNIIGEKKKRDRRRRRYTCIGKVRPAVSSCDVTQAPCGRLENGDGQVDNASNPLVVSGFCFLIYLNIFFFFQCFCIHNIERTAINRLNFHKLEQTL